MSGHTACTWMTVSLVSFPVLYQRPSIHQAFVVVMLQQTSFRNSLNYIPIRKVGLVSLLIGRLVVWWGGMHCSVILPHPVELVPTSDLPHAARYDDRCISTKAQYTEM